MSYQEEKGEAVASESAEEKLLRLRAVVERRIGEKNVDVWLMAPQPELNFERPETLIGIGRIDEVLALVATWEK